MSDTAATADTVVILCAVASGMILELNVETNGVGHSVKGPGYQRHVLKGSNANRPAPKVTREGSRTYTSPAPNSATALSPGVTIIPKDFAERWFARNANLPAVKNGLVRLLNSDEEVHAVGEVMRNLNTRGRALDPNATFRTRVSLDGASK